MWEAPASLELCIEIILHIEQNQSYSEILVSVNEVFAKLMSMQTYLEIFLLETYNISPVCWYIIKIWPAFALIASLVNLFLANDYMQDVKITLCLNDLIPALLLSFGINFLGMGVFQVYQVKQHAPWTMLTSKILPFIGVTWISKILASICAVFITTVSAALHKHNSDFNGKQR